MWSVDGCSPPCSRSASSIKSMGSAPTYCVDWGLDRTFSPCGFTAVGDGSNSILHPKIIIGKGCLCHLLGITSLCGRGYLLNTSTSLSMRKSHRCPAGTCIRPCLPLTGRPPHLLKGPKRFISPPRTPPARSNLLDLPLGLLRLRQILGLRLSLPRPPVVTISAPENRQPRPALPRGTPDELLPTGPIGETMKNTVCRGF